MSNKSLRHRIAAIEAKSNQVAEALEMQRTSGKSISAEEAERTYKMLMRPPEKLRSKEVSNRSDNQLAAFYLRAIAAPYRRSRTTRVER